MRGRGSGSSAEQLKSIMYSPAKKVFTGEFKLVIGLTLESGESLEDVAKALLRIEQRDVMGKIVVVPK